MLSSSTLPLRPSAPPNQLIPRAKFTPGVRRGRGGSSAAKNKRAERDSLGSATGSGGGWRRGASERRSRESPSCAGFFMIFDRRRRTTRAAPRRGYINSIGRPVHRSMHAPILLRLSPSPAPHFYVMLSERRLGTRTHASPRECLSALKSGPLTSRSILFLYKLQFTRLINKRCVPTQ
jgi:hypothetical protein